MTKTDNKRKKYKNNNYINHSINYTEAISKTTNCLISIKTGRNSINGIVFNQQYKQLPQLEMF